MNELEIDRMVAEALAVEVDPAAYSRARARAHAVVADLAAPAPASASPTRHPAVRRAPVRRRVLVLAAVLLLLLAALAAAGPASIRRLFGDDPAAPANQVEVLQQPRAAHSIGLDVFEQPDRYPDVDSESVRATLDATAALPGRDGEPDDALIDELRTFVSTDTARVVGVPTARGRVCYVLWVTIPGGGNSGACVTDFTAQTPVHFLTRRTGDLETIGGVAADAVRSVDVRLASGSLEGAVLVSNGFVWSGSGVPVEVQVTLDDGTRRTFALRALG